MQAALTKKLESEAQFANQQAQIELERQEAAAMIEVKKLEVEAIAAEAMGTTPDNEPSALEGLAERPELQPVDDPSGTACAHMHAVF